MAAAAGLHVSFDVCRQIPWSHRSPSTGTSTNAGAYALYRHTPTIGISTSPLRTRPPGTSRQATPTINPTAIGVKFPRISTLDHGRIRAARRSSVNRIACQNRNPVSSSTIPVASFEKQ